ncbi:MAG: ribosomal-processing cysteine protease Prp [Lachnospiraceae bacterium]|nr:ribosomal-processing cysteine protease Prp [Lachnospiraceae bacterium]
MIKAVLKNIPDGTPNGRINGFVLSGHANYAKHGKDIVCAAVSMLAINTVNSIETLTEDEFEVEQGESGELSFRFTKEPSKEGQALLDALRIGLESVKAEYGSSYIEISKEVEPLC